MANTREHTKVSYHFTACMERDIVPLQMRSGDAKPSAVAFYEFMTKPITDSFNGAFLPETSPIKINVTVLLFTVGRLTCKIQV